MEVEWKVEPTIHKEGWEPIMTITSDVSGLLKSANLIVDLGGGSGWFGVHLATKHPNAKIISVDIVPRLGMPEVTHIKGSVLDIPINNNQVDFIGANAILHHVPNQLDKCMAEVSRLLKPEGLFLTQEPLADNPIARWTRKFVTTTSHEKGECPLEYQTMINSIKKQGLEVVKSEFFFLTSYLMPHLVPRLPMKGLFRRIGLFMTKLDRKILANFPKSKNYAAYVSIVARKPVIGSD